MLSALNRFLKGLNNYLREWVRFFGRILVSIGSVISGQRRGSYQVVCRIIETSLRSLLIQMKVYSVSEDEPLFVRFIVHVRSAYSNKIDWAYFRVELMQQIGCSFNDISGKYMGEGRGVSIYQVDITKTALSNLELGRTEIEPGLFQERDTEYRLKRTLELAKETTLTPELLEKELEISSYHANLLYEQVTKSEALPKHPKGKLMN